LHILYKCEFLKNKLAKKSSPGNLVYLLLGADAVLEDKLKTSVGGTVYAPSVLRFELFLRAQL